MVLGKENVIVPFLNLLLSGFSTLRSLSTARAVRERFLVDKMAMGQISVHVLRKHVVSYSINAAISLLYNATVPHSPKN